MATINTNLSYEQFNTLFSDNIIVRKFSAEAKEKIFKAIGKAEKSGDVRGWVHWFINAKELTSAEVYDLHWRSCDGMGGALLDLLHDHHRALFDKTGIDFSLDDGESVTDIELINSHHDVLIADNDFMTAAVGYIQSTLDRPCIKLRNKKWVCLWADEETYSKDFG